MGRRSDSSGSGNGRLPPRLEHHIRAVNAISIVISAKLPAVSKLSEPRHNNHARGAANQSTIARLFFYRLNGAMGYRRNSSFSACYEKKVKGREIFRQTGKSI